MWVVIGLLGWVAIGLAVASVICGSIRLADRRATRPGR